MRLIAMPVVNLIKYDEMSFDVDQLWALCVDKPPEYGDIEKRNIYGIGQDTSVTASLFFTTIFFLSVFPQRKDAEKERIVLLLDMLLIIMIM